ncbi:hypothetical protein GCK32_013398, partial [Trichostrongylus colubriformis]
MKSVLVKRMVVVAQCPLCPGRQCTRLTTISLFSVGEDGIAASEAAPNHMAQ